MLGLFSSSLRSPLAALLEHLEGFNQPRMRRHELWAATCYIRPDALRELIVEVEKRVRLTKVTVVYEQSELLVHPSLEADLGALRLQLKKKHPEMLVVFASADAGAGLFHGKGYAVVQFDNASGKFRDATLLLTSGNCTSWGIGGVDESSKVNMELGLIINTFRDTQRFIEFVGNWVSKTEVPKTDDAREARFRKRVLLEARYLCKWDGSLRQQLSTIFKIDRDNSKSPTELDPELKAMGFSLETNSLSKCYFDMDTRPKRAFPAFIKKRYTIQTVLGHWMPLNVWRVVEEFQAKRDAAALVWLQNTLIESNMKAVRDQIKDDARALHAQGYRFEQSDFFGPLADRAAELLNNQIRRQRILFGYEALPLLANSEDEDVLADVFDSLMNSIKSRSRQNVVTRLLQGALKALDPTKVSLSAAQMAALRHDLSEAKEEKDDEDK